MLSTEQKKQIAQDSLTALRERDWLKMRTVMTGDIVWSLPGTSLISGEAVGVDSVVGRAQLIASYGLNFRFKHILIGQHGVALSLNNTAQRGALILDEHLSTVCSLRDGKIYRIDTYLSDVEMMNQFFIELT